MGRQLCRATPPALAAQETEAWMKALFELIPMLDKECLKSEIMSLALSKSDVEDNVGSRMLAARILGALAPCLVRGGRGGGAMEWGAGAAVCMGLACVRGSRRVTVPGSGGGG